MASILEKTFPCTRLRSEITDFKSQELMSLYTLVEEIFFIREDSAKLRGSERRVGRFTDHGAARSVLKKGIIVTSDNPNHPIHGTTIF